jgi:long-chain acyl-CoA synthetase
MIPNWLFDRAAQWSDTCAMIWADQKTTYADLLAKVGGWHEYFHTHNIEPGQTVAVCADFTPDACALLLALIKHAAIIVPMTMQTAAQHNDYFAAAEVEVTLTQRRGVQWMCERRNCLATHPLIQRLRGERTPGLIAFSSGSTGKPKVILHDFTKFIETYREQRRSMCTLAFLSFDHLGGINTLLYGLSSGGTIVTVASRDPETVCKAIAMYSVTLLPTSPTFLNLLLISEAYKHHDVSSLRLITYGSEIMPESTLQQLQMVLPHVRLQQTYAFSEGATLRLKSKEPGSLWIKISGDGIETRIVDGQLWVKSEVAMLGYLNAPNPFDEDGWLNTGDVVAQEGEYIRILGRKSEIINVGGEKVFPAEVENVILQMQNIKDVVVQGKANPIVGNIVAASVTLNQPADPALVELQVRRHCQERLPAFKVPVIVQVAEQELHNERFKKLRTINPSPKLRR